MQQTTTSDANSILNTLEDRAGQPRLTPFRQRAKKLGSVYAMSYTRAVVAMYDYDREQAGGVPQNMFLLAAKPEGDESFILLRVLREARLPNAVENEQTRQKGIEDSGNDVPWADKLPEWMRDRVSLHAVECRVLGTFIASDSGDYEFAEDVDNYYAVHELMVWKPDAETLDLIVNHRHRTNGILDDLNPEKIGRTRFAAAERDSAVKADFKLNPTDVMKRRTASFGMSRSGKSNGLKVVAKNVYRLRYANPQYRVGQLIFDLNGEYAQDNPQDGKGLYRVHESLGFERAGEVETYGLFRVPWDPDRKIMKLNFFGDPIPTQWDTQSVETALEQLLAGRDIIKNIMAHETTRYTTAFRDVDIAAPQNATGDKGAQVRYRRTILAYQTALAAAGLARPKWTPSTRGIGNNSLFRQDLIKAMQSENNTESDHQTLYHQAATLLARAKQNGHQISWNQLEMVFTALNRFINDKKSGYDKFEQEYINQPGGSGDAWADPRLKSVIRIFESPNGPRLLQKAQEQHDPDTANDFADAVVADLNEGKLVIIDQSGADDEQAQAAAERVMWRVFRSQQDAFKRRLTDGQPNLESIDGHIIVYIEEAHNLLPKGNARENLKTVWARAAKEGSKLNIGMVLATQAPSSIMPEILSETDNWILAYLNSDNERRVIAGYMDFADFLDQIGKVSEQGFVRIKTLSQAYTVPVQLDKFSLGDVDTNYDANSTFSPSENGHHAEPLFPDERN